METGKYTYAVKFNDVFPVMMDILGAKKQNELAHFLDVSVAAITNFKTQNYFPIDQVIKFAIKKNISIDRMLGRDLPGGGDSPGDDAAMKSEDSAVEKHFLRRIEDTHYSKFPLLLPGGRVAFDRLQMLKLFALKEWLLPQLSGRAEDIFMTVMEGNSMDNAIGSGDILLCDGIRGHISDIHIDDSIYVLCIESKESIIRRLQRLPGNMIQVIADNKLYESFSIPVQSDCQILGKVIWVAHRVVHSHRLP